MNVGDHMRTRIAMQGIPVGTICIVLSVWEPQRGVSCDVECTVNGWRSCYTMWASELEALVELPPLPDVAD